MGYLETLKLRRVSPRAVEHQLRMAIGSGKYKCYLVVEGDDDEIYYSSLLLRQFPNTQFTQRWYATAKGAYWALGIMLTRSSAQSKVFYIL